jgi:hypothetical protein
VRSTSYEVPHYAIFSTLLSLHPLGKLILRWVDNIKIDLREIGWDGMGWIYLAQDKDWWKAVVNTVMNLRVPYNAGNFLSDCITGGF